MEEIHYELLFKLKAAIEKRIDDDEERPGIGNKSVYYIVKKLEEHIETSASQLERIWYWEPTEAKPSIKMKADTLRILLGFIEFKNLKEFQDSLIHRSPPKIVFNPSKIKTDELEIGEKITLGWYPDKYCRLEKGEHPYEFRVIENVGFKKKIDNVFYAPGFYLKEVEGQEYPDILIDSDTGWFDEPEQQDLKNREDYFLL